MSIRDIWPEIEMRHMRHVSEKTKEVYTGKFDNLSRCKVDGVTLVDIPISEIDLQMVNGFIDLRIFVLDKETNARVALSIVDNGLERLQREREEQDFLALLNQQDEYSGAREDNKAA